MLIRLVALVVFLVALWMLFRFAMGLRAAKQARSEARAVAEAAGRRVVAELPLPDGLVLFLEDESGFYWGHRAIRKRDVRAARLRLGEGVVASFALDDRPLPDGPDLEIGERERWEVIVHLTGQRTERVPCGSVREGVSREAARQVFEALRRGATGAG
jgi:hypothetical protein